MTRWSRVTTQSETYSSMPNRVRLPTLPRSPVMTTVRSRSLSQRNRRPSSPRMIASLGRALNSSSMVSRTTRLAPTDSTAIWSRMNSPSRSKEPVSTISAGSSRKASIASSPSRSSCSRSKPSEATLVTRSAWASSKASRTPGSPKSRAPRTRNSIPNMRLSRACSPRHQGRSASRQTTVRDLVEAGDPGRCLLRAGQNARSTGDWLSLGCHCSPRPPRQSLLPHALWGSLSRKSARWGSLGDLVGMCATQRTRFPKKKEGPRRDSCACLPLANAGSGSSRAPSGR